MHLIIALVVGLHAHAPAGAELGALIEGGRIVGTHEGEVGAFVAEDPQAMDDRAAYFVRSGGQAGLDDLHDGATSTLVAVLGERPRGQALSGNVCALQEIFEQGDRAHHLDRAQRVHQAGIDDLAPLTLHRDLVVDRFADRAVLNAS